MQIVDFSELGCVVMASGLGTRFGSNKLLAKLDDKTLIEHILATLRQAGLKHILIVTRSKDVAKLAQDLGYAVLLHELPYQSDTVALGVRHWLKSKLKFNSLLFTTGDQPLLKSATLQQLCTNFLEVYNQKHSPLIFRLGTIQDNKLIPGNPVIFSKEFFPELLTLPQDKGGSVLCKKYPDLVHILETNQQELFDIDTQEDLQQLQAQTLQQK